MESRAVKLLAVAVLLFAATSCASFRGNGGKVQLEIEVINNLVPPGPVYVYMIPNGGIERDLGTVFGGTHVVQVKSPLALSGDYQFVAKTGDRTIVTPVLVLDKTVLALRWDLERNFIQISQRAE